MLSLACNHTDPEGTALDEKPMWNWVEIRCPPSEALIPNTYRHISHLLRCLSICNIHSVKIFLSGFNARAPISDIRSLDMILGHRNFSTLMDIDLRTLLPHPDAYPEFKGMCEVQILQILFPRCTPRHLTPAVCYRGNCQWCKTARRECYLCRARW